MRHPQQAEVVRAGKAAFRARSDARNAALNDELLTRLLNAALDVLHHDRSEGTEVDDYERATLRNKFARILKIKV